MGAPQRRHSGHRPHPHSCRGQLRRRTSGRRAGHAARDAGAARPAAVVLSRCGHLRPRGFVRRRGARPRPLAHAAHIAPPAADTLHRRGQRPHSPRRHGRTFPRPHAAIWRLLRFAHIPRRHPPVIQLPPHPRQHILQDRASDNRLPSSPRLPHTPCRRPPAARNAAQAKDIGVESRRGVRPGLCNKEGHPHD